MAKIEFVRGAETPSVSWWEVENSWCSNSYLVMSGHDLYIIDSGIGSLHRSRLLEAISQFRDAERVYLFNTHWHLDHSGNGMIMEELGQRFPQAHYLIPETARADMQGFMERSQTAVEVDMGLSYAQWLGEEKEEFHFGAVPFSGWRVEGAYLLQTPGHSPDSVSIYLKDEKVLLSGDLLWYVNPNGLEGSIDSLLQSTARVKRLVEEQGIDYLGGGHFLPIEGRERIIEHISGYEEKERALVQLLEEVSGGEERVSVDHCLEVMRESEHPALKEALRVDLPYFPSYLQRFIRVFLREKGWQEVEKGTWSIGGKGL